MGAWLPESICDGCWEYGKVICECGAWSCGSSGYTKRIKVNVTGMVRAKFELRGAGSATLSYVLETTETIHTVNASSYSSYTSYSKDFPVCAGDVISLHTSPAYDDSIYMEEFPTLLGIFQRPRYGQGAR